MSHMIGWVSSHIRLSHLLFIALTILGAAFPEMVAQNLSEINHRVGASFDWLIVLSCMGFIGFCLLLAFSRYGHIRLGSQEESPEFGMLSWIAMLFAAGMGTGLVFYGAAEPLYHMVSPPPQPGMEGLPDALAAKRAMIITYVHWGLHAWAIYTVCALTIAYFTFRQHKPMLASSPMHDDWESRIWGRASLKIINLIAVLAVVFGLVASLAQGIMQMHSGLVEVGLSIGEKNTSYGLILLVLSVCYIASALTGLGKGIRILSDINMSFCILLMLFILLLGPTHFILETFATSFGDYISRFISLGTNLRHYSDNQNWTQNWTLSYFLWWIAWGPFVGVFIARISRGRTIREFIMGVLFIPSIFSMLWFSTLGGTGIHMDMFGDTNLGSIAVKDLSGATFALLRELPLTLITSGVTLFLIFIFLVTSADSGSYVLGMFTSEGNPNPPTFQKLFWGSMVAVVTAGVLLTGKDLMFVRAIAMAGALPYMLIMILQCMALWKYLKRDIKDINQPFVQLPNEDKKAE